MKYPRLPENLDLRKKLLAKDIEEMQAEWPSLVSEKGHSKRSASIFLAGRYGVSPSTILYHCDEVYRVQMMAKNAKAHAKSIGLADYEAHRTKEVENRQRRIKRNPSLRLYHDVQSAKNEHRLRKDGVTPLKRHTVKGIPLETLINISEVIE